jgi:uncharacterized membrane protein
MITTSRCCINCNSEVQRAIIQSLEENIFMFSAFIVLSMIILFLFYWANKHLKNSSRSVSVRPDKFVPLTCAAIVLGIGIGGLTDGIVLHQILQWHEMLSNKFPTSTLVYKSVNMFWDGFFHLFTLLVTIEGIYLLWKVLGRTDTNKCGHVLIGGMLAGWGIFNLIEGTIDHQILGLHNVRELSVDKELWNNGFLLFGMLLIASGSLIIFRAKINLRKEINSA